MSDIAVGFFNPADVLSLGGDWVQQENNIVNNHQVAIGLGATGDAVAKKSHGGGSSGPVVYECHAETGNLTLPNVGKVAAFHIDSLQLVYQPTGWPRLTCNVHQHDDNAHADDRTQYAPSITLPAQFGVPAAAGGVAGAAATAAARACTYTLGCTHQDEDGATGNHLAGENRDGIETLAYEYTGDPGAAVTGPDGWIETSEGAGTAKSNTAAETKGLSWENHVAAYVAP